MDTLGIYLGPQIISIIETRGRQLVNNIGIMRSVISGAAYTDEKVPEEVKITSLIKEELRKRKIESKDTAISLSGRDLIIRSFEIPVLPREELTQAVNFEVRKYIPFKVEDLVSDYQCKLERATKKYCVLFVGIKKETLDKYIYITRELGLKVKSIEYSAFNILKLHKLMGIKEKGVIANINMDLTENDEANFIVLEDGFPLFSRDITLFSETQEQVTPAGTASDTLLEKLKREIRISLDYYDRTFPLKTINKIFFLMDKDYRTDLEAFIKEWGGLSVQFVNFNKFIAKYIGKPIPFSLSFLKGYSSSLLKIDSIVKIDLFLAKEKTLKKVLPKTLEKTTLPILLKRQLLLPGIIFLLVCAMTFAFGVYRSAPLKKDLKQIINMRPAVSTVSSNISYDELAAVYGGYKAKIKFINDTLKQQIYASEILNAVSQVVPEEMWLEEFSFKRSSGQAELILRGFVSLGDPSRELETVNKFLSDLRGGSIFSKYFKDIEIVSIDRSQHDKTINTIFTISCKR